MAKHPTNKRRKTKQRQTKKYGKLRDTLQRKGVLPMTPEGAVRSEVVDPATQDEQSLPSIERQAVRNGWAVPEAKKPIVIDRLAEIVETGKPFDAVLASKVLLTADKMQHERDNPKETKGLVNINLGTPVVDPMALYREALESVKIDSVEQRIESEQGLPRERIDG